MLGLVVNSRTSKIRASKFLLARSRATVRLKMQSKAERPPASTPVPRAHRFDEPNNKNTVEIHLAPFQDVPKSELLNFYWRKGDHSPNNAKQSRAPTRIDPSSPSPSVRRAQQKYGRDPLGSVPGQADVPAAGGGEGGLEKGQKTMCTFTYRVNFPGTLLFVLLFNGYL